MSRLPDPTPLIWLAMFGLAVLITLVSGTLFFALYHLTRAVLFYIGAI